MAESDSVTYGIHYCSPLNDIEHFHVANMMQMPQDVMHVLFEGILGMEIHMMLCEFFKKKYLTLSVLNERLNAFDFGTAEARNRPPKSFKEKNFDSSSSKLHLSGIDCRLWLLCMHEYLNFVSLISCSCSDVDICFFH